MVGAVIEQAGAWGCWALSKIKISRSGPARPMPAAGLEQWYEHAYKGRTGIKGTAMPGPARH
jgi:hypothetical protein